MKKKQLPWLTLKASYLLPALERAHAISDDWQAECLEILLVPEVNARWVELTQAARGFVPSLEWWIGLPDKGLTRDDNEAIYQAKAWTRYAGYTLRLGEYAVWNSVREDYHSHSASTCWNGVQRETYCLFVEHLRGAVVCLARGDANISGYVAGMAER